jgi:hypothetical protein
VGKVQQNNRRIQVPAMTFAHAFAILMTAAPSLVAAEALNSRCIEELKIPDYTPLARNSGAQGTAVAHVEIQKAGPHRIEVHGVGLALDAAVRMSLDKSRFDRSCAGRKVILEFEFRVGKEKTSVTFLPPNKFVISTSPAPLNLERRN